MGSVVLLVGREGDETLGRGTVTLGAIVGRRGKEGFTRRKLVITRELRLLTREKLLLQILDLKRVNKLIGYAV